MVAKSRLMRALGVVSIFVSLPVIEAGVMAVSPFWREGDTLRMFLSSLGSLGGFLIFTAGILLLTRRSAGRTVAQYGSTLSIVACTCGAFVGLVGGHGVLYGVGFPIAILLLLHATPGDGLSLEVEHQKGQSVTSDDKGPLKMVMA